MQSAAAIANSLSQNKLDGLLLISGMHIIVRQSDNDFNRFCKLGANNLLITLTCSTVRRPPRPPMGLDLIPGMDTITCYVMQLCSTLLHCFN
jgi:hypothetical protein